MALGASIGFIFSSTGILIGGLIGGGIGWFVGEEVSKCEVHSMTTDAKNKVKIAFKFQGIKLHIDDDSMGGSGTIPHDDNI